MGFEKIKARDRLFFASLLLTVSVASCSPGELSSAVRSLAVISTADIAPVAKPNTLARIQQTGKVRVAVPDDFPPFGSVDPYRTHLRSLRSCKPFEHEPDKAKIELRCRIC